MDADGHELHPQLEHLARCEAAAGDVSRRSPRKGCDVTAINAIAPLASSRDSQSGSDIPRKLNLFGALISDVDYQRAERVILDAARHRRSAVVTHLPVHGVVTAAMTRSYRKAIDSFDIVAP